MASYNRRLASSEWDAVRREAYARAGYRCTVCGRKGRLQAHHTTYRHLGHERPGEVVALCPWHHFWQHPLRTLRGILRHAIRNAILLLLLAFAAWVLYPRWGVPGVLFVAFIGLMMVKAGRKYG